MESTETIENKPLSVEEAVQGILAPQTDNTTETVEDELQATEEETVEATDEFAETEELTAEADEEEVEVSDETDDIELSAEDEIDNDYEEDAVQEEAPDTYSVKVDGQVKEVTLDELKQGYSGQEYVQKGMQEAAQQRKQAEEVYEALLNERQQVVNLLQQLQNGDIKSEPVPPSKSDFQSDPIGFMEKQMEYQEAKAEYDKQMTQVQNIANEQSQAEQIATQTYLKQEMEKLTKVIPEFADPNKVNTIKQKLVTGGSNYYGYTPEEIGQVMDSRAIIVLRDAIAYRDLKEGKTKAIKKTSTKRVVKAGAKKVNDGKSKVRQKQMAKLKQTGSIQDAVSLIMNS